MDFERLGPACALARQLRDCVGLVKVGSQLFTAEGPKAVKELSRQGLEIFLDLKFHDVPNSVAGAIASATALPGIRLLTLHTLGGFAMMVAARKAADRARNRPRLLGVTILTSLDTKALRRVGLVGAASTRAVKLARLAKEAGLDGVVASAQEARAIRNSCGRDFLVVVPGVRPTWAAANDQARVATPAEAIRAGADYLVVGRPITASRDPHGAATRILSEICEALRRSS